MGLSSCQFFKVKEKKETLANETEQIVARVGSNFLYVKDLKHLETSSKTSLGIDRKARYVENWIKRELMIKESKKIPSIDFSEIEKKVEDYRYSLLSYEYEKYYINKNLNLEVSDSEINDYYAKNSPSFILQDKVVQVDFFVFPLAIAKKNNLAKLFRSNMTSDKQELKQFSLNFAENYIVEDSTWYSFDDLVIGTPFSSLGNKKWLLKKGKTFNNQNQKNAYFLKIKDIRFPKDLSPISLVKEDIKKIILNKRKIQLTKSLKDKIYKIAQNNNEFEIFTTEK